MTVTHTKMRITPEMARDFLKKNVTNRNISQASVSRFARDIESGQWRDTAEALKFDWNGKLIDGQHRLYAVLAANRPVEMWVARGLDPTSQSVMDTGRARTAGDAASIRGVKNATSVMAISRLLLERPVFGLVDRPVSSPSNSEQLAMFDAHPEIAEAATLANRWRMKLPLPASWLGAMWVSLARIDADAASTFFDGMCNLDFDGERDPRKALYTRLQTDTAEFKSNKSLAVNAFFHVWNKWRQGEEATRLILNRRDGKTLSAPERLV